MFDEIHLIREWIGAVPLDAPLYPIWGYILRWAAGFGGDVLATASTVSLAFFAVNAVLIFFATRNLFVIPVKIAERRAGFDEVNYKGFEYLAAVIMMVLYLVTPGFLAAAHEPSPLTSAQFPVVLMYLLVSGLLRAKRLGTFVSNTILIGVFAAVAFLSGAIGWLPLPLAFLALLSRYTRKGVRVLTTLSLAAGAFVITLVALSYFLFEHNLQDLLRVTALTVRSLPEGFVYPGAAVYFFFGVLPLTLGVMLVGSGRVRPIVIRLTFFLTWAAITFATAVVAIVLTVLGAERPNIQFVNGILAAVGDRDVIISDGTFDDMLSFRLPRSVTMLTLGVDREVPDELVASIEDPDSRFAAELGATAFAEEWLKNDTNALDRVVIIAGKNFTVVPEGVLVPEGWCSLTSRIAEMPKAEELRKRWEERWHSIAAKIEEGNSQCRYMRRIFALQGLEIVRLLRAEGQDKSADALEVFVTGHVDSSFSREAQRRREIDRDKVIACVRKLGELDELSSNDRSARLVELEDSVLPELERTIDEDAAWLLHVYRGEIALKKGKEFHTEARDEYRAATHDERSDLKATAGKLLLLDASLRDEDGTKDDALAILRRDRANVMALAIWGNRLAAEGDNAKAELYLRRATSGDGPVMLEPLNDLAEVLCRQGKLEEALATSDRVIEHAPENWTFRETRAALLMRLGRLEEAAAELDHSVKLADEAHATDLARNILDIDRARLMLLRGNRGPEFRLFVRNIQSRSLTPAHRRLIQEIADAGN